MKNIYGRIRRVREKFLEKEIDALFLTSSVNVSYFSGFTGDDSYLLITYREVYFISDPRYEIQAEEELPEDFKKLIFFQEKQKNLVEFLKSQKIKNLGIEEKRITYANYKLLKDAEVVGKIIPSEEIIDNLRIIKDREELLLIKDAISISQKAMDKVFKEIVPGISEREIAAKFSYLLRLYGAQKESFDTIVGSGPRGSLPHGLPTDKIITESDVTVIDFGVYKNSYNSDMTRTIKFGKPSLLEKEIFEIVKEAQERAISLVKPGIKAKELDKIARDYIISKGYGSYFKHGLGHGVGMEVHESPYISPTSEIALSPGMIITIEPGIYLPGKFGVRIEDMVAVTRSGGEVLTSMNKNLNYI